MSCLSLNNKLFIMKKFLILTLFTALFAGSFTSCSDNESIENEAVTQESTALRIMINEMKNSNTSNKGMGVNGDNFFIDFVYPINLSFNNGTVVTVSSQEGLISILNNETSDLYITGIAFPFQFVVGEEGTIVTINNEDEFWEFIEDQDVATYDDYVFSGSCYEFVYPLSFLDVNNQTVTVANQTELLSLFSDPVQGVLIVDFIYPFSVIYEGQIVVVNNEFEYYEISEPCFPDDGCVCPEVYDPVCVQTAAGVLEFPNQCVAECAGFTTADFLDCDTNTGSGFEGLGTCFTIQYPIQVQFQGAVFNVNNDSELTTYLNSGAATVNYPIVIMHATTPMVFTIASEAGLISVTSQLCN